MVQEILKLVKVWSNYNKKMMVQLKIVYQCVSHILNYVYRTSLRDFDILRVPFFVLGCVLWSC